MGKSVHPAAASVSLGQPEVNPLNASTRCGRGVTASGASLEYRTFDLQMTTAKQASSEAGAANAAGIPGCDSIFLQLGQIDDNEVE